MSGTSTHKVGEVAQTLLGATKSASTISRLNQSLTQQFEAWRQRPRPRALAYPVRRTLIHFDVRHGDRVDSTIILTADGEWTWTALKRRWRGSACAEEDKEGWVRVLHDLRARGATQLDLIVTDGHAGVLAALKELFPTTPRQRWKVA